MNDNPASITAPADLQSAIRESRLRFNDMAGRLRPRLHAFCARMCGSSLDGEDVVQETLAEAFYNLASLKDPSRFEAWMFRIAYHKCIDFLRRERRREDELAFDEERDDRNSLGDDPPDVPTDAALAALVGHLPPKERASVVLKDVLDYSLAEIADIADTTLAGVKAALHRGREKLRGMKSTPEVAAFDPDQRRLFDAYAECFNRRDWDGLKQLVRADARLEIVGANQGTMSGLGATYSGNYVKLPYEWRLTAGLVDGAPVIIHWRRSGAEWRPVTAVRLWWENGRIVRIRDYIHVEYLLANAAVLDEASVSTIAR